VTVDEATLDVAARVVAARLNLLLARRGLVTVEPRGLRRAESELAEAQVAARREAERIRR
jgi:hypothetical protein